MTTIAVFTTIDRVEQARVIANTLVERKLAACVQISAIESVYTWEYSSHSPFSREHIFVGFKEFPLMGLKIKPIEGRVRKLLVYQARALLK